jgi:hypothetical protein
MRLFSNRDSVRRGEVSVLAVIETIVATAISIWLAWRVGTIQYVVIASAIAPFLLLRTRLSVWYQLKLSEVDPMVRTTGSGFLGGTAAVRFSQ